MTAEFVGRMNETLTNWILGILVFGLFVARRLPDAAVGETAARCSADPQGARLDLRFPAHTDR